MWERRGLIFDPAGQRDWMVSHACTPTAFVLDNDTFRIFFAPRDQNGRSIPSFVDVDATDPSRVLRIAEKPIMDLGETGTFDDDGIMPCSLVRDGNALYLYYVGWNRSVSVPYRNAIGLAVSHDNGLTFERPFPGAVIDRNRNEAYFTASPCAMKEKDRWRLWYASTIRFIEVDGRREPIYVLKEAQSADGVDWDRPNRAIIPQSHPEEAIARPTVIRDGPLYRMWFCYRGSRDFRDGTDSYRIGYAESQDGTNWTRDDDRAGLENVSDGFDSAMQTYPNVIRHRGRLHLFYNGNGFGRDGIGYAVETT